MVRRQIHAPATTRREAHKPNSIGVRVVLASPSYLLSSICLRPHGSHRLHEPKDLQVWRQQQERPDRPFERRRRPRLRPRDVLKSQR